jgi:quinol monooxygenase YgiN
MNEGSEIPSDDALVFIVQLHLKPERVEDWKRAVNELIDRMSQEDAFVTCLLDQSTEDPGMFTLYEQMARAVAGSVRQKSDERLSETL